MYVLQSIVQFVLLGCPLCLCVFITPGSCDLAAVLLPTPSQPMEVYVDDDTKLTLHGLQQHYIKLQDREKNRKLFDLLDALEFNQLPRNNCCSVKLSQVEVHGALTS